MYYSERKKKAGKERERRRKEGKETNFIFFQASFLVALASLHCVSTYLGSYRAASGKLLLQPTITYSYYNESLLNKVLIFPGPFIYISLYGPG